MFAMYKNVNDHLLISNFKIKGMSEQENVVEFTYSRT